MVVGLFCCFLGLGFLDFLFGVRDCVVEFGGFGIRLFVGSLCGVLLFGGVFWLLRLRGLLWIAG